MEWQEIAGNWILVPRHPVAIVHFLGGAFVASAPQVTYRWLLEQLAKHQYAVIATPFDSALGRAAFDHEAIARSALLRFESALDYLRDRQRLSTDLPIYGVGHSLGCKLHLLGNSLFEAERAGNILLAFNNYSAKRAIPFFEQVSQASNVLGETLAGTQALFGKSSGTKPSFLDQLAQTVSGAVPPQISQQFSEQWTSIMPDPNAEFKPSPMETQQIVAEHYTVPYNLLVQFKTDTIDQTDDLYQTLSDRASLSTYLQTLEGTHLTPLGQDLNWSPSTDFSPLDAVGQFVKQGSYQELNQLRQVILGWLSLRLNSESV